MNENIGLSIFIPSIPLGMTIFIFILLRSFNRTINRLTKPISFLAVVSTLSSTLLSFLLLWNHVEGDVPISNYSFIFNDTNLVLHLNALIEKILIIIGLSSSLLIIFSAVKLPRGKGFVLYVVNICFLTSIILSLLLVSNFNL